jgi:ribosome-binding factor A
MATIRQNKVSRLLQREMGDIFQKLSGSLFPGGLATITNVEVSADLSIAKLYISILGKLKPQETIDMLMTKKSELRNELSHKVKHQLRIVPDLRFYIDESYEATKRIEDLLKKDK